MTERALLAGTPILNLLKCGYWNALEQLAEEPAAYHRTMYGNRIAKEPSSPLLQMASLRKCSVLVRSTSFLRRDARPLPPWS